METVRDELIRYEPAGALDVGVSSESVEALEKRLEGLRSEILGGELDLFRGQDIPPGKQPLDAGFLELPQNLLEAYASDRDQSELGQILATAQRLQDRVDRVVLLGIGGSYMGARALMEACCDPYHNELSRAERGGIPRLYFEGNNVDNDASQALLRLLGNGRVAQSVEDRWAIVVISKSGGTIETAVAFRQYLSALRASCGEKRNELGELVVPVTGFESLEPNEQPQGKLLKLSKSIGCKDTFYVPEGVGGRFSIFSAVGLLPAAILGIDIVRLLEGAAAMNEHFRTAPAGENVVLKFVAVGHSWEAQYRASIRILSVWSKSLEAVGLWYDQLLAESLGKAEVGATPVTTVNTRDLHSRAQQHQEGRRDKLITNIVVDRWRSDALAIPEFDQDDDQLNEFAGKTLPELMSAALRGTNQAYQAVDRPTANIHLPQVDAFSLGQLFQMFMLATVVEGRLLEINPYGQPGVEAYKKNMVSILRGEDVN